MTVSDIDANASKDWVRQPIGVTFWWVLPILLGVAADMLRLSFATTAFVWAGACAWMGTGCVLNALRCGRLHCFISGPALWSGAVAAGLIGAGTILGPGALGYVLWGTAAVVGLSYVPEVIWGRYGRSA